jgi:enamine deaminase RidA (YjgF/YER057c/UK114 family)
MSTRDAALHRRIQELGLEFGEGLLVGGNYRAVLRDGDLLWVAGQVPRVGSRIAVCGRVGDEVGLQDARRAAEICAVRALLLLRQSSGSLERIRQVLRVGVFVAATADFAQHSEVADAASDLLHVIFGEAGVHVRTSVGAASLPKNATVELELVAAVHVASS